MIVRDLGFADGRQAVHVIDDQVGEPEVDTGQYHGVRVVGLSLVRPFEEAHLVPLTDVLARHALLLNG